MKNKSFASDNNSGVHPDILQSIIEANKGDAVGYGDDKYTKKAIKKFKEIFGEDTDVYFVFTGTGANIIGLKSITNTFNSIICAETAHINVDECGAPEIFTGCKLLPIPTKDGKINVEKIKCHIHDIGFEHHSQPKVVSITNTTELGTLYSCEEIKKISNYVHANNMYLHMDGARISNASASLKKGLKEITKDAGVDVLSFGGTKNGMMYGEAVLFFNKKLSENTKYFRKQSSQLCSKMRFISAQFIKFFENDLWLKNATHSNKMAKLLEEKLKDIPEITITQKVESNSVFAIIPQKYIKKLQEKYFFYMWDENKSEVRWMTSYDTEEKDIDNFVSAIKNIIA
ncbi:MAG: low specificity L-threonine aldolase [Bacteroidales bacterium]|nr:low specificity L-threonine aldolase [Bacteroidales bacterium]